MRAVLVTTSHVVRGAVGGRASVFALERMGFPVWFLPTAVLPWHPGQGRGTSSGLPADEFEAMVADLARSPRLGEVRALLTGYIRDAEEAAIISGLVSAVRQENPHVRYLCDPIFGDAGGRYRPDAVVMAMRHLLLPQADIITPNRHELGWLTGVEPKDNDALISAACSLGAREVAVTSAFAPPGRIGTLLVTQEEVLLATHERVAAPLSGTGDLFAALYLGHRLAGSVCADALAQACSAVLCILKLALETGADEMPIIAGQHYFAEPPMPVAIERLE
jgi:pyridoxine kinase